jgi:cell division protein FtsQ
VQSVGTGQPNHEEAEFVRAEASRRIVLPRVLRRPVRALRRLDWKLPRLAGTKALVVLAVATATTGVVAGGHSMTVTSAVTAWVGFGIENVKISGQTETSEIDVLNALDIGTYPSLLTLELDSAKQRIEALPWVKTATLRKLFPDSLEIEISERDPYALWQHDGLVSLIDISGRVITEDVGERYTSLPRVVGQGAAPLAATYTAMLSEFPAIEARARAGVYVSGRRWTIVLDNGMQLMLPPEKPEAALATIATMEADHAVFSREISVIDLRRPGQLIVRLTDKGVVARKAALKERAKVAERGRTNT